MQWPYARSSSSTRRCSSRTRAASKGAGDHRCPTPRTSDGIALSRCFAISAPTTCSKHSCLDLAAQRGIALPDTPPMAVHRGRVDLLERHWQRDPTIATRTFAHEEIFPQALGCHLDPSFALVGTPLGGATLLHMCVDF